MARDFDGPQNSASTMIIGTRSVTWIELTCPECRRITYIVRDRRLARTGSQREFTLCAHCGGKRLTLGRIVAYPTRRRSFWERVREWRHRHKEQETLEVEL